MRYFLDVQKQVHLFLYNHGKRFLYALASLPYMHVMFSRQDFVLSGVGSSSLLEYGIFIFLIRALVIVSCGGTTKFSGPHIYLMLLNFNPQGLFAISFYHFYPLAVF